ncbi:hypothetical protein ACT7C6_32660 [Bacillus paranthracis]
MQKQQNDERISDTRYVSNMNILQAQREDMKQAIQWYELQAMSYLSRQGYSVYLRDWKEEKTPRNCDSIVRRNETIAFTFYGHDCAKSERK